MGLFDSLWHRAKRRHPHKSAARIMSRYRHRLDGRGVFAVRLDTATEEKPVWLRLFAPGKVKIWRHIKIRAAANPLDPKWRDYFADRAFLKWGGLTRSEAAVQKSN